MAEIVIVTPALIQDERDQDHLNLAVGSVLDQTFTDWEMWIVADGANVTFGYGDARILVATHDQTRGPGAARNTAARASSAPWILPLDADDRLAPDALARLYAARDEHAVLYGDLEWIGDKTGVEHLPDYDPRLLIGFEGPLPVTALHHRSAWELVGGWDESLAGYEDLDYWIRLAEQGVCPRHIEGVVLEYRQHAGSRHSRLAGRDLAELQTTIRERHSRFFAGGFTACRETKLVKAETAARVELKYQGYRQGFFRVSGAPSGNTYEIDGRGAHVWVDPADVAWFETPTRYGQEYVQVGHYNIPPAAPIYQPPVDFSALPVQTELPDISVMGQREALKAAAAVDNLPDLRVLIALENGVKQRPKVLEALETRRKELEDV